MASSCNAKKKMVMSSSCPSCHGREPLRSTCGLCNGGDKPKKPSSCGSGRDNVNVAEDLLMTPELGTPSQCRACRRRAAVLVTSRGNFCSAACSKAHVKRSDDDDDEEEEETENLNEAMTELMQSIQEIEEDEEGGEDMIITTTHDSSLYDIFTQHKNFGQSSLAWYGQASEKQDDFFTFSHSEKHATQTIRIAYTAQGKRGPLVLLIPALGIHRSEFSQFQTLLSPFCRTLAMDPLNTGESSKLEKRRLHLLKFEAEVVEQLVNSLYPDKPSINVVGSEWGGVLALQLSMLLGDRVQSLALFNPIPEMRGGKSQKMIALERCKGFLDTVILRATGNAPLMMGDCKLFEARIKDELRGVSLPGTPYYDPYLVDRAHALKSVYLLPRHLSANPGGVNLKIPVLFAYGQKADPMVDAVAHSLPIQYGLKQYEVQEICKAHHLLALDQPRRTAQCYLHFLKGLAQQPVSDAFLGYPTSFKGDEPAIVERLSL